MSTGDLNVKLRIDANVSGQQQVDTLTKSVDGLGKEARDTGVQAQGAATGIDAIGKEAQQTAAQARGAAEGIDAIGKAAQRAGQQSQQFATRTKDGLKEAESAARSTGSAFASLGELLSTLGLAYTVTEFARQFVTVNSELERMERTFWAVSGSTEKAAEEMAYARDVADRLGLPLITVGKAWADLAAATKGTRVEGQATRAVFEAVSHAMNITGKTADETQSALLALSQMASKGVVSMEELRGQLGEQLPGALNAVASGFGITTLQLTKLVEAGDLTAEQLFPALTEGLNKLYLSQDAVGKQTETLTQKWDRFKNSAADAFKTLGDAGGTTALKNSLEALSAAVTLVSISLVTAGKEIGTFFAALKNGDIGLQGFSARAKLAFSEIEKEAREKMVQAARHNKVMEASLDDLGKAALAAAQSSNQMGSATAQAGKEAANYQTTLVRQAVSYKEIEKQSLDLLEVTKKSAEARKAEAAATVQLATALGTEREKLQANADATVSNADALRKLASERSADLALHERHLAGLRAEIATRGKASEAEQLQLDKLQQLVKEKNADADAALAQARSAAISAEAAKTELAAYADNSARVKELAAAYDQARTTLETLIAKKNEDLTLAPKIEAAQNQVAAAGKLYRDALHDQTQAIINNATVKTSQASVEQASIRLAIEQQRTLYDVARARGQEGAAARALLDVKRLEIRLAEAIAQAKKLEADAALAAVQAKRTELLAAGELTAAKEAELRAQEAAARVKQIESQISAEAAKRLRELADASNQAGAGAGTMGDRFRQATEDIGALGRGAENAADKVDRLHESLKRPGGGGGVDLSGNDKTAPELSPEQLSALGLTRAEIANYYANRNTGNADKANGLINRQVTTQATDHEQIARQMGLTGPAVKAFIAQFADILNEEMAANTRKLRQVSVISTDEYLAEFAGTFDRAKQRAKDAAIQSVREQALTTRADPASVHRVEIQIGGKRTAVDTSSPEAAKSLIDALKELAGRAA